MTTFSKDDNVERQLNEASVAKKSFMAGDSSTVREAESTLKMVSLTQSSHSLYVTKGQDLQLVLPCLVNLELIWCLPGTFMMGSPKDELGRCDNEDLHQVTLTEGFYLGKFPITQEQYQAVICQHSSICSGRRRCPVVNVTWFDAVAFCERLNKDYAHLLPLGYKFCLPTEAQWEYACRAGTSSALNNGKELTSEYGVCSNLDQLAWYVRNSDNEAHMVGKKPPNAWGIYDMHGNVCEWCSDWYGDGDSDCVCKYDEEDCWSDQGVVDPLGPSSGSFRVNRGGSWFIDAGFCRSACRYYVNPGSNSIGLGFRLAATPV